MDLPSQLSAPGIIVGEPGANFSRLDLVQHSMLTIIELLRVQDSLIIVTFDSDAKLALAYTEMTAEGKYLARNVVKRFSANGSTNLWKGLEMAMDLADQVSRDKHIALVLQTDGAPSACYLPMRGIQQTLQNKLQSMYPVSFTIHTCGYGYGDELDSKLLRQIATLGNGSYAYISDGSMVGTVYIHLLCNLLSVVLCNVKVVFVDSLEVNVGPMRVGQPREFFIAGNNRGEIQHIACTERSYTTTTTVRNQAEPRHKSFAAARAQFVDTLAQCVELAECGEIHRALDKVSQFATMLRTIQDPRVAALLSDTEASPSRDKGQIPKSFQYWDRWGKHYLPSMQFAHSRQEKVNFKDQSLEMYSTPALEEMITHAETVFSNLPPPSSMGRRNTYFHGGGGGGVEGLFGAPVYGRSRHAPNNPFGTSTGGLFGASTSGLFGQRTGGGGDGGRSGAAGSLFGGAPDRPLSAGHDGGGSDDGRHDGSVSIALMISPASGCFTGDTQVMLESGSVVRMDALTKGCKLLHGSTVQCVVMYHNTTNKILRSKGLGITEYHPMRFCNNSEWAFPADVLQEEEEESVHPRTIFNLVLDSAPHFIQTPSGIQCVTLGHGLISNNVVTHPYFGTNACLEDVKQRAGYEKGQVEYHNARAEIDPLTGLVCRIV